MQKLNLTQEERQARYRAHNLKVRTDHPTYYRDYYQANRERILQRAKERYKRKVLNQITNN